MEVGGEGYLKQKDLNPCTKWQIPREIKREKYPLDFTIRKFHFTVSKCSLGRKGLRKD